MKFIEVTETNKTQTFINVDIICSVESIEKKLTIIHLLGSRYVEVNLSIEDVMTLIKAAK